jgi:hypothetical protein
MTSDIILAALIVCVAIVAVICYDASRGPHDE